MALIDVKNLSVSFSSHDGLDVVAVDDISFSLKENEIVAIVGESGSGKSVTALSILGLLPYPKAYHSDKTSILFEGKEILGICDKKLQKIRGRDISYIFQEPMSSLNPLHIVEKQILEVILLHEKISISLAKKKVLELLRLVGIENPNERVKSYPHELSGGQKQRVMIAMAIANNPKILVADEPTTALDVTIQKQILDLLLDLKKKTKMSILFISHDLNVVKRIADRVVVMKSGKIVETGSVLDVFSYPKDEYTKLLLASSMLKNKEITINSHNILQAKKLNLSYILKKNLFGKTIKRLDALKDVSFELRKNETLGIVGESGSGKSSLAMSIANLIKFEGEIVIKDIIKDNNLSFSKKIQIVFQDPYNSLNPRMNIEETIGEGLLVHFPKISKVDKKNKIVSVLREVGLSIDDLEKYPHEFSGGQRQRIAIARSLVVEPEILILDEPTSALDVTIQKQILDLLKSLQVEKCLSYIFISHDMQVIRAVSDRVLVMKNGEIVESGNMLDIFTNPQKKYTKELVRASLL